jgi:hypothetical protein
VYVVIICFISSSYSLREICFIRNFWGMAGWPHWIFPPRFLAAKLIHVKMIRVFSPDISFLGLDCYWYSVYIKSMFTRLTSKDPKRSTSFSPRTLFNIFLIFLHVFLVYTYTHTHTHTYIYIYIYIYIYTHTHNINICSSLHSVESMKVPDCCSLKVLVQ